MCVFSSLPVVYVSSQGNLHIYNGGVKNCVTWGIMRILVVTFFNCVSVVSAEELILFPGLSVQLSRTSRTSDYSV